MKKKFTCIMYVYHSPNLSAYRIPHFSYMSEKRLGGALHVTH